MTRTALVIARKHLFRPITMLGMVMLLVSPPFMPQALAEPAEPDRAALAAQVSDLIGSTEHASLKGYLEGLAARIREGQGPTQPYLRTRAGGLAHEVANAAALVRDANALAPDSVWRTAPLLSYVVPAISPVRRMPDRVPADGSLDGRLVAIGTPGEYVPASFVIAPLADVRDLTLSVSALTAPGGTIAADAVGVKLVKCWYQAGTAWYSYFADPTHRELVPELLLNDPTLIRVDHERQENYVRVDYPQGPQYVWVSGPPEIVTRAFDHHREPVADSDRLLPTPLHAGQMQQFWVTFALPRDAAPGLYEGTVALRADDRDAGRLDVAVRVLPFTLPDPATYYDLQREFHVFMYHDSSLRRHLRHNGGDWDLAEAKLKAELANMRAHNLTNQHLPDRLNAAAWNWNVSEEDRRIYRRNLELIRDAGFRPPLFDGFFAAMEPSYMAQSRETRNPARFEAYKAAVTEAMNIIEEVLGHRDVYFFGWDEPPRDILLNQREAWQVVHELGGRIHATSRPSHFTFVGHSEDIANFGGFGASRERASRLHALGHRAMSYAGPHTGPENPDVARRTHGMVLYKAWYDGSGNYMWYNRWDDFDANAYRSFNMVYPTQAGVIDTLAWEGFREGIDDIRYATLLKQLAQRLMDGSDVSARYEAKKALVWLELHDEHVGDLNTMRLEMIHYILRMRDLLAGAER